MSDVTAIASPVSGRTSRNSPEDLRYWLALHHAPGIGPVTFHRLLDRFTTPRAIFETSTTHLKACGINSRTTLDYLQAVDWQPVADEIAWAEQPDNQIVTFHDPRYPALLREVPDPPPLLYVRGDVTALSRIQLAIVGSRNPSPVGYDIAGDFARYLAGAGMVITSGLALGIDAAAHEGALAGGGLTIAVTGTGLDRVYPARHQKLAHQIAAHGALVSEFPLGTAARAENFPRRNRLISGLSVGTLVVEAGLNSGSLITARMALEQGREVFAIPGSIHNPLAKGCHLLIRQGAKLVEKADDILEEVGSLAAAVPAVTHDEVIDHGGALSPDQNIILNHLGFEPTSVDTLVARTGMTPELIAATLLALELLGHVSSAPGGMYCRLPKEFVK